MRKLINLNNTDCKIITIMMTKTGGFFFFFNKKVELKCYPVIIVKVEEGFRSYGILNS